MNVRLILAFVVAHLAAVSLSAQRHRSSEVPISGPTSFRQQPFDVLHYDAWIDLTAAPSKQMSGVCEMRIQWIGDPASGPFYFHLRDLTIDSVLYDGVPVDAVAEEAPESPVYHYRITPPATAGTGDTAVIRVVYGGEMQHELGGTWGGVTSSGGTLFALGVGFSNNYVSATQHWLPCYDHPSDKATFHGRFRVMKGMAVASNGVLTIVPESDSTVIYDWNHDVPCATYLLTFAVDEYVPLDFPGETPPMVVYARPRDTAATRVTFKLLPRMVHAFEQRFVTYPFEKVGYVNTPLGAMEHQTMISFPTSLSRSRDTVNSTGAHELAHQWFGDLVSPLDFTHAWLNESFATYCESAWAEELGGFDAYLKSQEMKANRYINAVAASEGLLPLYNFPRESPSSNYPETIYQKGAVVVGMLRYELGDSVFHEALRDYLTRHAYGSATTDDLRAVLEEHAGRSLGWFFDQWVYGKGWPVLTVRATPLSGALGLQEVEIRIEQIQADSLPTFVNLPVEIGFETIGGGMTYRTVRMNERLMTITMDSIPEFRSINVNRGPSVRALLRATAGLAGIDGSTMVTGSDGIGFFIRPNPASAGAPLSVEARGFTDCGRIGYELYDSSGRYLKAGVAGDCNFTIPSADLASGSYLLRFTTNGRLYDTQVMIAK